MIRRCCFAGLAERKFPGNQLPPPSILLTAHRILVVLFSLTWMGSTPAKATPPQLVDSRTLGAGGNSDTSWPQWRGPYGTGVSRTADPPIEWSETKNVAWKKPLPGTGHSTPVIWDDVVFITTAEPIGDAMSPVYSRAPGAHDNSPVTHRQRFVVMAIAREDGNTKWRQNVHESVPHEGGHFTASHASNSPVTDGRYLIASFGSNGIYGLSIDGQILWKKSLGKMQTKHGHGEGGSPALHDGVVVVNWDHEGESFIVGLDAATGEERWRNPRAEVTSWATPIVVAVAGRPQVIVSGTTAVRGYDLYSGKEIWRCGGLSHNVVASPVADGDRVYVGSSYESRALFAIRLPDAEGDITDSNRIVWSRDRATPYVPSPLLYDGTLYFLRHYQGILTRVHAKSGDEMPGPHRLGPVRDIYASPVAAAKRTYFTDLDGTTVVMSHEQIPRLIAVNRLDDSFSASAALAGNELYLRGKKWLYCLKTLPENESNASSTRKRVPRESPTN